MSGVDMLIFLGRHQMNGWAGELLTLLAWNQINGGDVVDIHRLASDEW